MYTIQDVDILVTYPDDSTELITLEAPNGDNPFRFGFRKYPILNNYDDGVLTEQRGNIRYQFVAMYEYASHTMDIRKFLAAKKIELKFPPYYHDKEEYQSAEVLFEGSRATKNYLEGLPVADNTGDIMPSGSAGFQFVGVKPLTEAELMNFLWGFPESTPNVQGATVFEFCDSLYFIWDEEPDALSYNIYLDDEFEANIEALEYWFQGLSTGVSYTVGVQAVYENGNSSIVEIAATPICPPSGSTCVGDKLQFYDEGVSPNRFQVKGNCGFTHEAMLQKGSMLLRMGGELLRGGSGGSWSLNCYYTDEFGDPIPGSFITIASYPFPSVDSCTLVPVDEEANVPATQTVEGTVYTLEEFSYAQLSFSNCPNEGDQVREAILYP